MSFIFRLYDLLNPSQSTQNEPTNTESFRWDDDSDNTFWITDPEQFSKAVIPKWFKHTKYSSFVRQLNVYGMTCVLAYMFATNRVSHFVRRSSFHHSLDSPIMAIIQSNAIANVHALAVYAGFKRFMNRNGDVPEMPLEAESYFHPHFLRGRYDLLISISRKVMPHRRRASNRHTDDDGGSCDDDDDDAAELDARKRKLAHTRSLSRRASQALDVRSNRSLSARSSHCSEQTSSSEQVSRLRSQLAETEQKLAQLQAKYDRIVNFVQTKLPGLMTKSKQTAAPKTSYPAASMSQPLCLRQTRASTGWIDPPRLPSTSIIGSYNTLTPALSPAILPFLPLTPTIPSKLGNIMTNSAIPATFTFDRAPAEQSLGTQQDNAVAMSQLPDYYYLQELAELDLDWDNAIHHITAELPVIHRHQSTLSGSLDSVGDAIAESTDTSPGTHESQQFATLQRELMVMMSNPAIQRLVGADNIL
jgi:hypothetical protein